MKYATATELRQAYLAGDVGRFEAHVTERTQGNDGVKVYVRHGRLWKDAELVFEAGPAGVPEVMAALEIRAREARSTLIDQEFRSVHEYLRWGPGRHDIPGTTLYYPERPPLHFLQAIRFNRRPLDGSDRCELKGRP